MRMRRLGRLIVTSTLACAPSLPLMAETVPNPAEQEVVAQLLVDLDALVIGLNATLRCALFDDSLDYLTPIEAVAVDYRARQIEAILAPVVSDLPDRLAQMRAEATAVPCGHEGLAPFLAFNADVARDLADISLLAWADITIEGCSYFADEEFVEAVTRAQAAGTALEPRGDAARLAYLEENATRWGDIFRANCYNVSFDPVLTLPGQIALALPTS